MEKVHVGVIGTGFMGTVHAQSLRRLRDVEVVAIADYCQEAADKKARELNISGAYGDYRQLVADSSIDVVHVCTPNSLHYPVIKSALEAGKHVFAEKPLAVELAEAEELLRLAKAKGLCHGINFVYRYYPLVQHARDVIARGELGELYLVHGRYLQDWLANITDFNWRVLSQEGGPSRAMADIGSHLCDLLQFLCGEKMEYVFGNISTILPLRRRPISHNENQYEEVEVDTEDYAACLFKLESGTNGAFHVSQVSSGHKNDLSFEISGSKGSLAWSQERPGQLWMGRRDQPNQELIKDPQLMSPVSATYAQMPGGHEEGWLDSFTGLLNDFYNDIINGVGGLAPYPTFADGLWAMQVVDALLVSHQRQEWVEV